MLPRTLDEWSLDGLLAILAAGYREEEHLDYKEMLPHPKDEKAKRRLKKCCCAFANSDGGFLIFGVKDDRSLAAKDRIVGLGSKDEFEVSFGSYPSQCHPSVYWRLRNPPLRTENNLVHVVYIPRSWNGPHAVGIDGTWFFPKRTNKGTEPMSYEEVRQSFVGYYEKRLKLNLLQAELHAIIDVADDMSIPGAFQQDDRTTASSFDFTTIQSLLVDTYSIVYTLGDLVRILCELRAKVRAVNNALAMVHPVVYLPLSNKNTLILHHNRHVQDQCVQVKDLAGRALSILEGFDKPDR